MSAPVQVYAVEGEFGRPDEGPEVDAFDAALGAEPGKGVGKGGIGGPYMIHIHGAVAPCFVHVRGDLHGDAHHRAQAGGAGAFADGEDIVQRNSRAHAHEEVVQPSHNEERVRRRVDFHLAHLAGRCAVHAEFLNVMPAEARGEAAPRLVTRHAVTVGKAVAKAEYVHASPFWESIAQNAAWIKLFPGGRSVQLVRKGIVV